MKGKDLKIHILEEQVKQLQGELDNFSDNEVILSKFSDAEKDMITIIGKQVSRLKSVSDTSSFDKDDAKIFDTLVKNYVSLRGQIVEMIKTDDDLDEDEIASLVLLVNGQQSD